MTSSEIETTAEFARDTKDSAARTPGMPLWRILVFLSVFLSVLMAANWFVGETLDYFWGPSFGWTEKIISVGLTLAFIVTTFLGRRYTNFGLRLAYRISAVWLGVLNFTFFAACATWMVSGIAGWLDLPVELKAVAEAFFGAAILVSIYGLVNANRLRVTRVTVNLPNLPAAWRARTVALVTDLHLGSVRGSRFARRVVSRLQRFQPAAVFISGDLFDGPEINPDRLIEPWKQLTVPDGIFYVTGNHEEFADRAELIRAVQRTGIRVLHNEKVDLNGLQILGVHDREAGDPQQFEAVLRQAKLDRGRASILLAHQPRNLDVPEKAGISLQLSGHTHGGQIWPWTWLAARVHGRFNYGLNRFEKLQIYTSSGAGTWGVPMRVGTKSEVILIRLEST